MKTRQIDQQNREEIPEIELYVYGQLIIGKDKKSNSVDVMAFSASDAETLVYLYYMQNKETHFIPHTMDKNRPELDYAP